MAEGLMRTQEKFYPSAKERKKNHEASARRKMEKLLRSKKSAVFLAVQKNEIAGFMVITKHRISDVLLHDTEAFVEELFVKERWRGRGAGTALLSHAQVWGRRRGCHWLGLFCSVKNKNAIGVYRNAGLEKLLFKMTKRL
jgi:ribosomal protein S18 acetylase RimI-like enzyme